MNCLSFNLPTALLSQFEENSRILANFQKDQSCHHRIFFETTSIPFGNIAMRGSGQKKISTYCPQATCI